MRTFWYVDGQFEARQEQKRSVFIATVKGELNKDEAEEFVKSVRKRYSDATHNCYAYVADELGNVTRSCDDGEPSGTAGQPILEVLKKHKLCKTAIVVTRYFGGIKLGASGLVGAYSSSAAQAIAMSALAQKAECMAYSVAADYTVYAAIEKLMREEGIAADDVEFVNGVRLRAYVPLDMCPAFEASVAKLSAGRAEIHSTDEIKYCKLNRK